MQLSSAVLLALVAAHLAQAYETYPFPSFFKTMDPDDPYLNGFCLTTGEPSIAQTTGDDKYDSYNPCTVGEVGLWSSGQSFLPNRLGVGMISNSAVQDLGPLNELSAKYGLTNVMDPYFSIHFDANSQQLLIGKGSQMQPLSYNDTANLRNTSSGYIDNPTAGNVYIIRLSDLPVTTPNDFSQTTLFAKLVVVEWDRSQISGTPRTIRWDVIYTSAPIEPADDNDETGTGGSSSSGSNAVAIGAVALAFSLINTVAIVAFVLVKKGIVKVEGYDQIN